MWGVRATPVSSAFRLAVDQTKRYLRGRERKYVRWYDEKPEPQKVQQKDADDDDGQDSLKDGRYGVNLPVKWSGKRNWDIKPFIRKAGLKAAPQYYVGDGFGTVDRPRRDVYPYTLDRNEDKRKKKRRTT